MGNLIEMEYCVEYYRIVNSVLGKAKTKGKPCGDGGSSKRASKSPTLPLSDEEPQNNLIGDALTFYSIVTVC